MDSFLWTFVLVFAIALGGREQLLIAQFSQNLQKSWALLFTAAVCAVASAALLASAGALMAAILPQRAAEMLMAFALGFAAIELFWPVRVRTMREPTRSLIAIGTVLFARQAMDAARFVIFAFAAEAIAPVHAFAGGALGGIAAAALGWALGASRLARFPLRAARIAMGSVLLLAALLIGLNARFVFL